MRAVGGLGVLEPLLFVLMVIIVFGGYFASKILRRETAPWWFDKSAKSQLKQTKERIKIAKLKDKYGGKYPQAFE